MRDFMSASGYVWESAEKLLTDLSAANLVEVRTRREGSIARKEISLTREAQDMLPHLTAIEALHRAAAARRSGAAR